MKNSKKLLAIVALLAFAVVLSSCKNEKKKSDTETEQVEAESTAKEGTKEIIFENDYAQVMKITLEPNEILTPHEGKQRLIYSLTDYSIDWSEEGNNGVKYWKMGDVHFHEAGEHAATNNGSTTAEWLVFLKKEVELPDCAENTLDKDVNSVVPEYAKTSFENEMFKLTDVTLPANESIPMHSGVNRIIYSLTDYQILYESNLEGKVDKTFKNGDLHWHDACSHALENNGETEAKFLVVAYKK